jgi:Ca-activated chloride channel homolog
VPLAPIYPSEGTADANYPFALLKAPWVDKQRQQIAGKFLTFLRSETGRKAYGSAGFRDADGSTRYAPGLSAERGFQPRVDLRPRAMTQAASVTRTVVAWTALRRRANILAVLDTSGSMGEKPPGSPISKLQIVQLAAGKAAGLFSEDTKLGLWQFATDLNGKTDYRQIVPVTPVGGKIGGTPTRLAVFSGLKGLQPKGNTGLYNTAYAAYLEAQENWEAGRINLVVLMTDGQDDNADGMTREQLLQNLKNTVKPDKPVQIVTIAYGSEADVSVLQDISRVTGGRTFVSRNPADIEKVFLAALFGSR